MVSNTATVKVQELEFPFTSVAVSVSAWVPVWMQRNCVLEITTLESPQASIDPALAWETVIDAFPFISNHVLTFWQSAFGRMVSLTVITELQVDEFAFTSVTVRVTEFAPTVAQEKAEIESTLVAIPQASEELESIAAAVVLLFPDVFR